ncbi:MAG: CPBP family intramembrane glutamic endopeptidase [Pseudomonadota bacterium]
MSDQQVRIDAALSQHPFWAVFWTVVAPKLYPLVALILLSAASPSLAETISSGENPRIFWTFSLVLYAAWLIHLMVWSEHVSGQPFAGRIRLDSVYLAVALFAAPFVSPLVRAVLGQFGFDTIEDFVVDPELLTRGFAPDAVGVMMIAAIIFVGPLVEEIVYRGVGMGCLIGRGAPTFVAAVAMAAIFALQHTHLTWAGMTPIFVFGLFLGWLRAASGGIAAPILAHMVANAAAMAPVLFGPG